MKCPKCQAENRSGIKFCEDCGAQLEIKCPSCNACIPPAKKFCGECGLNLQATPDPLASQKKVTSHIEDSDHPFRTTDGERKHVTVIFSDMSGYTSLSETFDPEDVKEITSRIFDGISKIIVKYDGFIEKYIGDAVMAIFGAEQTHEDDPVRAIRAAIEIHELVDDISPIYEKQIGKPLSMHTGINTGLVITGEVNLEKGTHGIAGDTINLAARLSSIGKQGDILVGQETYKQSSGHFSFEAYEPIKVKGKKNPVRIYQVLSILDRPRKIHRFQGLRAELIGREAELSQLKESIKKLKRGEGSIVSICGPAGTGKSRLVEEFKATLNRKEVQWVEGHAYHYTQNIPYSLLINLLSRAYQIEESDPPEKVREKIETNIKMQIGEKTNIIPYIGGLFSLRYPETDDVSPEFWKSKLQEAIQEIFFSLVQQSPTIICIEDLHWADPSSVELIRFILSEFKYPVLFLCVYRPSFNIFTNSQQNSLVNLYQEVQLKDLSPSETEEMVGSLLKSNKVPQKLQKIIQDKVEGNPFYLEELINSLIESETLIQNNGDWRIIKPISTSVVSFSIHGLVVGRLDRLDKETKRILQEASVIGRAFMYKILMKITEHKDLIDGGLSMLEQLDMIRTKTLQPDLEYMFKHQLTQEVVYNGILKKERREIHEQIAQVIENTFHDRLAEFYEALAFHFSRGRSEIKAVEYLIKSGEKSLARYAVEEAHQYFNEAFDILNSKTNKSDVEKVALLDILNSWAYTYYYLGEIEEFTDLFMSHKDMADSLGDNFRLGMFYAWTGLALFLSGRTKDSYGYLCNALKLGESSGNEKAVGYACFSLAVVCADLGIFADGIGFGEKALKISESFPSDQYLFFKSLGGLCIINWMKGDTKKVFEYTKLLLDYGERTSNSRCKVWGHWLKACGDFLTGDMKSSEENCKKAIEVASDPLIIQFPKPQLGLVYLNCDQFQEVEDVLSSCLSFCEKRGIGQLSAINHLIYAPALIAKGHMKDGLMMLEYSQQTMAKNQRRVWCAQIDFILGKMYSQIATGPKPAFSILVKNIGFLVKNVPYAGKKAEEHFKQAIEVLQKIGAKGFLGPIYLDLGFLYKDKKRTDQAKKYFSKAIQLFKICDAKVYMKQAEEAMASLG